MRLSALAATTAVATTLLAPPAQADAVGSVTLSIVGSRAGRGAVATCLAVAKPATAFVEVECSSDIMIATAQGVGAASAPVVGVTSTVVCGYAVAQFSDGTVGSASGCRFF